MKNYFKLPITSVDSAKKFYLQLANDDLLFHPEDDPRDVCDAGAIHSDSFVPTFTEEEAEQLEKRVEETYEYLNDPCEYILTEIYPHLN